ncbi:hypothetical protein Dacet_2230 [Denitrovibrio acetiphilus DSM 12809]|uniref:Peptidase S8/S53 domain-containing protein n=1 Tax=Denitrovibrio acetiphilus (strain DSM 12809 / NBRC 114555 / N2460) TaxID=522772 RepID=D4H2W9_DENA2|nr:S8 family peptidase [Denitrovibrio acetiphilus]ADD68992.1 hypothetical protein Dacet_2230 [Denitrovibrio acetiphilus DSM 12809]
MDTSGVNAPYILRFSKSMHKPNPRIPRGGQPRQAEGPSINLQETVSRIQNGYKGYKSLSYNAALPVFSKMTLKQGSLSKSLRYHFIKNTNITLSGSISPSKLIFSIENEKELERLSSLILYSRSKNFRASLTHIKEIGVVLPKEKEAVSNLNPNCTKYIIRLFDYRNSTDDFLNFLKYDMNIESELISTETFRYAKARLKDLSKIQQLFSHSLIQSIEPETDIYLYEQYIRHYELPLSCVEKRDHNISYPKAGLVDSGVSDDSLLREWELASESYVEKGNLNSAHGTFVCGRLLAQEGRFGGITFLNVEMIPSNGRLGLEEFERHMVHMLEKYHRSVKIYNISMGTNISTNNTFSLAAHLLDHLQKKYDVLFVISSGNKNPSSPPQRIASPAESVHSLSVGSVCHTDTNIQKKYEPSLFTRHGPGPCMFIKPDVSSFGGAHEEVFGRLKSVGVFSIGVKNELAEDMGTSHAAPLVTSLAAKTYHTYEHAFKSPDMTKALIIHHTFLSNPGKDATPYTGFGTVPQQLSTGTTATYMHQGVVRQDNIVELPSIPVPTDMFDNGRCTGEVLLTLVYKTETNINFAEMYCMYKLEASLGYYKNGKWSSLVTAKNTVGLPEDKDSRERFSWQPVKVMKRDMSGSNIPETLSLRIIPSKRDFYKGNGDISYSFVISFIHPNKNLYQCLRKKFNDYADILEPASDMWKTCGQNCY